MRQQTIIELNGRRYNAKTGELIGVSHQVAIISRSAQAIRNVDGVMRSAGSQNVLDLAPKKPQIITPKKRPSMDILAKNPAASLPSHRTPQKSQTLRRQAVKKPSYDLKPKIVVTTPSELTAKPKAALTTKLEKKLSVTHVQPARLLHAKNVHRSHHIQRFSRSDRTPAKQTMHHLELPIAPSAAQPIIHAQAKVSNKSTAEKLFEAALANATTHEQKHQSHKKHTKKHRIRGALAGIAAFAVIGGFLAYLMLPGFELQVASIRAGFHATTPSYTPGDQAYNRDISAEPNKISFTFSSGQNSYRISQTPSNINSSELAQKLYTERGMSPDETIQSRGRTIYLYPDGATWVSNGIEYSLSNNAHLDPTAIAAIAASM